MVPIDAAALPGLDAEGSQYVESIVALDANSPEFAAKAADVRTMGDDDIRAAAETSNRLLQAPVRAMQRGGLSRGPRSSATLLDLRRTIEDLDPEEATGVRKLLGLIPFGDKLVGLLPQVRERAEAPRRDHQGALRRPGRAPQGQRRARAGEDASLGDDAAARPVHLHRRAPRHGPRRPRSPRSRPPTPSGPRRCATTCCSTCARSTRTCSPSWRCRSRATSPST